jgi:hypothetical protein
MLGTAGFGWALEQSEERLIIAAHESVKGRIQPQHLVADFEQHFYNLGDYLLQRNLDQINVVLRRDSLPELGIRETDVSAYNRRSIREEHAVFRRAARETWLEANDQERAEIVATAQAEERRLSAPHFTYEEWSERQPKTLSMTEQQRRRLALHNQQVAASVAAPEPTQPPISLETAMRLLRLPAVAENNDLRDRILTRLNGDQALELAEQTDDSVLQAKLALYVLGERE